MRRSSLLLAAPLLLASCTPAETASPEAEAEVTRLAAESVSHYGDNGFPKEAAEVLAAAKAAGPVPFEPPFQFRARMRDVTNWMKQQGVEAEK